MAQCLTKWLPLSSLSETPFYPSGILLHGSDLKSVLLVWSRHVIKSFIFRGLSESLEKDLAPSKSNWLLLPTPMELTQLVVGVNESFVITSTGNVFSFRTAKSLQKIPQLTGVRCACVIKSGFAMIRLSSDAKSIFVYIQPDNFAIDQATTCKQFDISSDANLCESSWADSMFCIKELTMQPDNPQLFRELHNLRDEPCNGTNDTLLMFSINCNLLSLRWSENSDDFQLHLVQTFESSIVNMWHSDAGEALFILLQSGSLDVLHCCGLTHIGVRRSQLYIGDQFNCLEVFHNMVIYSNGTHVVQSGIKYDKVHDSYSLVVLQETAIFGVVALTLTHCESFFLAVTENSFIYKIPSQTKAASRSECLSASAMCVVDDIYVTEAKKDLASIIRLTKTFEELRETLLKQHCDTRLMELMNTETYCKLSLPFEASVSADLVCFSAVHLSPIQNGSKNIQISININPKEKPLIDFSHSNWTLSIEEVHLHRNTVRTIPITDNMFQQPLPIVFQTTAERDSALSIPQIQISINCCTTVGRDKLLFSFAVTTHPTDVTSLFKLMAQPHTTDHRVKRRRTTTAENIKCIIRLPTSIAGQDVFNLFNSSLVDPVTQMDITLLDQRIHIFTSSNDDRLLHITSNDSTALYYVKQFILLKLHSKFGLKLRTDFTTNVIRVSVIYIMHLKVYLNSDLLSDVGGQM